MGLRFLNDAHDGTTAMYDSVSGWAFGPTFENEDAAQAFLDWCETQGVQGGDVRRVPLPELETLESRYYAELRARGDDV
jgi:hypothetical protein